jgi:hypothetical protein
MYDNDRAGVRNMESNALRFGIQYTVLPDMMEGRKDISDFFSLRKQKLVA